MPYVKERQKETAGSIFGKLVLIFGAGGGLAFLAGLELIEEVEKAKGLTNGELAEALKANDHAKVLSTQAEISQHNLAALGYAGGIGLLILASWLSRPGKVVDERYVYERG